MRPYSIRRIGNHELLTSKRGIVLRVLKLSWVLEIQFPRTIPAEKRSGAALGILAEGILQLKPCLGKLERLASSSGQLKFSVARLRGTEREAALQEIARYLDEEVTREKEASKQ